MTASAGPGSSDPSPLLLVCPTPELVAEAKEAGFPVVTIAETAGFTDDQLRDHLVETVRTHRVGMLIACGDASTLPAVLETAEHLGVSPNPAAAARSLADASQIRGLLTRSGPQWEALALPTGPGDAPPSYDIEYGVETLTVEGMHRVTGIVELRSTGKGAPSAGSGPAPGTGDGTVGTGLRGTPVHTFPAPITRQEEAEIRALATGLLDLAGYEFGYAFTRVARTDEGPRVVESLPRQASWPTSRLIELTTGLTAERELVRALSGIPLDTPVTVGCAAAVPLPDPTDAPARGTAQPEVREVREGYALLTALTPAELATRAEAVLGRPAPVGLLPAGEGHAGRGAP
ncbi:MULTISPECIES: hypothetical protein [Streptomyces]|uniref:ATP-grasp domain-containing protein n=1 Tax=Streptomyces glycanivorans TaxID=3033808 RepID=A0ABY9JLV2_9ACTN|nr:MULTISPECIES: hypothetical protein [unclassified Streptomyces]TXS19618.1 hypothetical protein EAO68_01585 [Streptomyces sp. wa22]WSQ82073.1 hypothetical protein OG725_35565 [Streptomyces sp. NBC_01213]WLQ68715.1 hypothetical protein P8A20_36545 [Streptomyces sp. Alt3]WSQ89400.1 hypothetical protein OG722_35950 [Streptomyces sp. NBC_01212]WSR11054.1 hypothetical protein OG265_35745 [Streptomyces sp. NBC_01208]